MRNSGIMFHAAVTKSGTGTWDSGRGDVGLGDARMSGLGDTGNLGDSRTWDVWTRGCDKQTTPEFCAEF